MSIYQLLTYFLCTVDLQVVEVKERPYIKSGGTPLH